MDNVMRYEEIEIGQTETIEHTIKQWDWERYYCIVFDNNSIHRGNDGIVFGMLVASFISTIVGNHLPGDGAIIKSQKLNYAIPVRVGDTITVQGIVINKNDKDQTITLTTDIYNQHGAIVIYGTTIVKVTDNGKR
jgi:3-oxoacyl-[acyl-carrier protein] reductase